MTCGVILSGQNFLSTTLTHVDCQAQRLGAYGWAALSQPGSPTMLALTSLLTVFVALFGIRLMLGPTPNARDIAGDALRIGIVLTLATSWPAWRVIAYDLLIIGPGEIATSVIRGSGLPSGGGDLYARLQGLDDGLAALGQLGSGRLGVATGDWFQLGFSRDAYLTGVITSHAFVRLMTGILLALAPLVAGLLLFGVTRSLFLGWAKALGAVFLASIAVHVIAATQLALLEPWLQDALLRRQAEQQVLDAPIELAAMTLAFTLVSFAAVAIAARAAFQPSIFVQVLGELREQFGVSAARGADGIVPLSGGPSDDTVRVRSVASAVATTARREERLVSPTDQINSNNRAAPADRDGDQRLRGSIALGASYRRAPQRRSAQARQRDEAR